MPPQRNKEKFQQIMEFEQGRIIGLREGGFSYRAVGAHVQLNSSTVVQVCKQWTDEHRTNRKTGSEPRKVTSASDDRHLLRMIVNDCTASSMQLAARWSIDTSVLMSTTSIRRRLLHRGLHETRFNLWDHDDRFHVRHNISERCLSECVIDRHSGLTPAVMVWSAISHHGQYNLLRIEGNLNSNRYVREVLQPEVVPFLQGIPGTIFQQDNARPHVPKTVGDFCSAQHMQLLP
ncbi:transposable element Tc1 transposase [Trichonephila clavipes]|nr:transposable element Tc1 transposase [Trichonephila clavipes]